MDCFIVLKVSMKTYSYDKIIHGCLVIHTHDLTQGSKFSFFQGAQLHF